MLTRIVEWNNQYNVGDKFILSNIEYYIREIEVSGNLARLWLR